MADYYTNNRSNELADLVAKDAISPLREHYWATHTARTPLSPDSSMNRHQTIDHFYSGRLFTLFRVGEVVKGTLLGKAMDFHFRKHLPRVFTGEATTKRYSVGLVDFMCKHGMMGHDPTDLKVR